MEEKRQESVHVSEEQKQAYAEYVKQITPRNVLWKQMLKAFFVGGCICLLGQAILQVGINMFGLDKDTAGSYCAVILVFFSAVLTGLNWYQKIVKFGGAGALVPITGFANSVAAAAIEYKKEGQVYGIGCKIFTIAGPVILYGILSSWLLGLLYFFGLCLR